MSIGTSPFQGGGSSSIADATETTAGKIRIATSTEASTGTNDTTAMTPLTVKERIDAAIVGGVEYKGTFNATAGTPSLTTAEKGDLYIVGTAGTIYGQTWAVGDHLLINDNMGGSISNSKIDKVDNTDAVSSVNAQTGAVVLSADDLAADHSATNYIAANANIDGHLEGIDDELALLQPLDAGLTSISGLTTAANKMIYTTGSDTYAVADLTSAGRALLDDADAAAQRTTLGLGTAATSASGDFQPVDAGLTSISGLTTAADKMIYTTGSDTYAVSSISAAGRSFVSANDAGAQRSALGLGTAATSASTDFQPVDAGLTSISGLTTAANKMIYTTGSDTYAVADLTSAGRALLDDADAAAQRTTLGLGTAATSASGDFQPVDAGLTSISGLTTAADKMIYTTGSDTYAVADLTSAGRALLDDADAAAQRTTLGLGSAALLAADNTANNVVKVDSNGKLPALDGSQLTNLPSGATQLNDLSDVTITGAATGEVLRYSGSAWVDATLAYTDISGTPTLGTAAAAAATDFQPVDAGLTSISGLTTAANKMIYTTGSDTYAVADLTSAGRALLDDADAAAQRTTLGLGTAATSASGDFQPVDAGLTSISGLTTAADKMIYTTGSDTYAVADLTSAGRALLDDADAAAQRTTLGLGTAATSNTGDFLANVSEDSSPQLGNDLDLNGHDLVTTSNADLDLAPNGTGVVVIRGNTNSGAIKLNCENNSHGVTIQGPPHSAAATYTLTLPNNDGDADQVLKTDGSGGLSWVSQTSGGSYSVDLNQETLSGDKTLGTPTHVRTIHVFTSSADRVINLPAASGLDSGQLIDIKSMSNQTFTITPDSGDKLDGVVDGTLALNVQFSSITLACDGTDDWFIV